MPSETHIVPILMCGPRRCRETSDALLMRFGIYVEPVNYPAVPLGTERLCLTPTPLHSDEQIDHLVAALKEIWSRNTTRGRRIIHSPASYERGSR
jgi:5-aminolevulinate synthase